MSQQQEELAPALLQELAVVSETLETTTREVSAEGRPTRDATQLAKEKAGLPSEFTPHSWTSAPTSWQPYEGVGATAGAVTGATAGAMVGATAVGGGGGGEDTGGGGGGGGWLPDTLSSATSGVAVGVATGLLTARVTAGVAEGVAEGVGVTVGAATGAGTVGAVVTTGVAVGLATGV